MDHVFLFFVVLVLWLWRIWFVGCFFQLVLQTFFTEQYLNCKYCVERWTIPYG